METFFGRKKIFLSPDCKTLVLFGTKYFGATLKVNPEETVIEVYDAGKSKKQFTFQQVFGLTIAQAVAKYQVPQKGGGWISSPLFVSITQVDWQKKQVHYRFTDDTTGTVGF